MRYFKELAGSLCYLSPINPEDYEKYTEWLNDLEVAVNLTLATKVISLPGEKDTLAELAKKEHNFAIVDLKTDELLGNCGLTNLDLINGTAEFGIFIGNKNYWNRGYGTNATMLLLNYGFNLLNLHNIILCVYSYNKRAIQTYTKCGFRIIGCRRQAKTIGRKKYDIIYMDIISSEYKKTLPISLQTLL